MAVKWDRTQAREVKDELAIKAEIGNCPNCGAPAKVLQNPWVNPNRPMAQTNDILVTCSDECWRNDPQAYIDAVKNMP